MFLKLNKKNKKRILWAALLLIVPSFVLWGSAALKSSRENIVARIENRLVTIDQFSPYIKQASLHWLINSETNQRATSDDIRFLAADFFLLSYQAKRKNITVSDSEVVNYLQSMPMFWENQSFSPEKYQAFIYYLQRQFSPRFSARNFEEYLRNLLTREKLFNSQIQITISDDEIKEAYIKDNQQANLAYILFPYQQFETDLSISDQQLEEFYQQNKNNFLRKPKIKVHFASFSPESQESENIFEQLQHIQNLSQIETLTLHESGYFNRNQPIQGLGFSPQINEILFSLNKGEISGPLFFRENLYLFQVIDKNPAFIPAFSEIVDEVSNAYRKKIARQNAKDAAVLVLAQIEEFSQTGLNFFEEKDKIEFQETGFFDYSGYIRGIGLSEKVSQLAFFELESGQIYDNLIKKENGIYLIKLLEKSPFILEDFLKEKETYRRKLKAEKELYRRLNYLASLRTKLSFQLDSFRWFYFKL